MKSALSLASDDDIDTSMRLVARNLAMDVYPLHKILEMFGVKSVEFMRWKDHPRFLAYLKSETEAWNAAHNVAERTKLKAGIVMEEWITEAYAELKNGKQPLNHRVELGKLMAKLAGMGESSSSINAGGGNGGFSLQINISPGHSTTINAKKVVEDAEFAQIEAEAQQPRRVIRKAPPVAPVTMKVIEDDDYDPFVSPDTLGDLNA